MRTITSGNNQLIKEVKSLKLKKYREEKNLFFIEGFKSIEEALDYGAEIVRAFVSDDIPGNVIIDRLENSGSEIYRVASGVFYGISDTESPQGILAVLKTGYRVWPPDGLPAGDCFYVMLDSIRDPGNAGTIIRTADATGVSGIILSKDCADLYNPKVIRASMGSLFHIPVYVASNLSETIKLMRSSGIRVYAADLSGGSFYFETDFRGRAAVVIGNESKGICDEVAAACDAVVSIPMPGQAKSLNAAVAAGIIMYEAIRQRKA